MHMGEFQQPDPALHEGRDFACTAAGHCRPGPAAHDAFARLELAINQAKAAYGIAGDPIDVDRVISPRDAQMLKEVGEAAAEHVGLPQAPGVTQTELHQGLSLALPRMAAKWARPLADYLVRAAAWKIGQSPSAMRPINPPPSYGPRSHPMQALQRVAQNPLAGAAAANEPQSADTPTEGKLFLVVGGVLGVFAGVAFVTAAVMGAKKVRR